MNFLSVLGLFLIFSQGRSVHLSFPDFYDSFQWPRLDSLDDFFSSPSLPGCRTSQTTGCHPDVVTVPALTRISVDEKQVTVKIQVAGFKRDHIQIKSYDNKLQVTGGRACFEDERCSKKVFNKDVILPYNTDFSTAKSYMSGDGWLIVRLAKSKLVEREVHIEEIDEQKDRSTTLCTECSDRSDEDEATVEVDESSQPFCSQTSQSNDLYDIGV